jgi:multiple sugar transport system substrate-binding protein
MIRNNGLKYKHTGGMRQISRRGFLKVALAGGATAMLSGMLSSCAPKEKAATGTGTGPGVAGQPAAPAGNVIEFMNWGAVEGTPLQTAIDAYVAETGTQVKVWPVPARYEDKMRTLLAAGTTPDNMRVNDDYVVGYAAKGQFRDLLPYTESAGWKREDMFARVYDFALKEGKYWVISIGNQPRLIYYNKNMFDAAGVAYPPDEWDPNQGWTWGDFLETAQKLTKGEEQFGCAVYHDTGWEQTWSMNNGGPGIYSEDGLTFTLADPAGYEAMQWGSDLTCVHKVQPTRGLLGQFNANQLFIGNKLAMVFTGSTTSVSYRRDIKDFDWDVSPPPMQKQRLTEGSLICFSIPTAAKNPDGGWSLLDWMTNEEMGKMFAAERYFIPIRKAGAVLEPDGLPPENVHLFGEGNAYHKSVNFAVNTERARFIYRPQLDLVYTCEQTAEAVLTGLRPEVEAALAGKF